ncbi:hypothetical protein [Legionella clemsonensis]|uniref:Oxidative stress defense protein n=1 Tax=Legionella clemsonensis TaxID=1867846 RepID=A0A222P3Q3_9GAMM|nr:hypothetical protein [Legionella clemsonensis]ASQ46490.1 hypothetical protein clem_09700 [Legionella clemsonensis]
MKKLAALLLLGLSSSLSLAVEPKPILDKVIFQISARQWVTTQTALLTVNVNATLTNADLVKARADIMTTLAKIAPGDWHLTQFDRSQDSSGLEKLFVAAEARVPQASLTNIYQNAKNVSKPGATYTIDGVEFKPSLEEVQQVKVQLRERLYKLVNDEIGRLNQVYPTQNYSLNTLIVTEGEPAPIQPQAYRAKNTMMLATEVAAAPAPALTVSNELTMNAIVEVASNREEGSNATASSN